MMAPPVRSIVCPACGSAQTRPFLSGEKDYHREIRRPFTYYLCEGCRLRFQDTTPEEARGLYGNMENFASSHRQAFRKALHPEAEVVAAIQELAPGPRLLEVGSGDGFFLEAACRAGFECTGVDVSEPVAAIARRRSGAPVLVGDLLSLDLPPESFDVINVDQVLMYVANPRDFVRHIAHLLRPGGVCRIREYDADSLMARVRGQGYWAYGPTRVRIWTTKSICGLAESAGLEVARIVPGTEATLRSWLAARRRPGLWTWLRDASLFWLRKLQVANFRLGADTVYYLRKPDGRA
jgi:SAM-dependent methyltransferase